MTDFIKNFLERAHAEDMRKYNSAVRGMQGVKTKQKPVSAPDPFVGRRFRNEASMALNRPISGSYFVLDENSEIAVDKEYMDGGNRFLVGRTLTKKNGIPASRDVFEIKKREFENLLQSGLIVRV
jgi:hypothetical protein